MTPTPPIAWAIKALDDYSKYIYSGAWSALSGFALFGISFPEEAPYQYVPVTALYMSITFYVACLYYSECVRVQITEVQE